MRVLRGAAIDQLIGLLICCECAHGVSEVLSRLGIVSACSFAWQSYRLIGARSGQRFELKRGSNDFVVDVFSCHHSVPCGERRVAAVATPH